MICRRSFHPGDLKPPADRFAADIIIFHVSRRIAMCFFGKYSFFQKQQHCQHQQRAAERGGCVFKPCPLAAFFRKARFRRRGFRHVRNRIQNSSLRVLKIQKPVAFAQVLIAFRIFCQSKSNLVCIIPTSPIIRQSEKKSSATRLWLKYTRPKNRLQQNRHECRFFRHESRMPVRWNCAIIDIERQKASGRRLQNTKREPYA